MIELVIERRPDLTARFYEILFERMRGYFGDAGYTANEIESVLALMDSRFAGERAAHPFSAEAVEEVLQGGRHVSETGGTAEQQAGALREVGANFDAVSVDLALAWRTDDPDPALLAVLEVLEAAGLFSPTPEPDEVVR